MATSNRSILIAILVALCTACGAQAHANELAANDAAKLYSPQTTYSIFRKGKNIGKHVLNIDAQNNNVNVTVESKITIKILAIPVFRFHYRSTEIWEDNALVQVKSTTKTDKKVETASLLNTDNSSLIANDTGEQTKPRIDYATNHWNISAVEQSNLFNTVKGVNSDVIVTKIGTEKLTIGGKKLDTTRYAYSGDITAESWYDQNNRWVKLGFVGSDGSQITYLIDNP